MFPSTFSTQSHIPHRSKYSKFLQLPDVIWKIGEEVLLVKTSHLVNEMNTKWKVSKYGVFSGPYFPSFGLNTVIYSAHLRIQSKYRKIRTRKDSPFGRFSSSGTEKGFPKLDSSATSFACQYYKTYKGAAILYLLIAARHHSIFNIFIDLT